MSIGERIKDARKNKHLSQEELGKHLGIGKSSISEWESDKRSPPIDTIEQIASILGTSVPNLMGWAPEHNFKQMDILYTASEIYRKYNVLDTPGRRMVSMVINEETARIRKYGPLEEASSESPSPDVDADREEKYRQVVKEVISSNHQMVRKESY